MHDETDLARTRRNLAACRGNLYNAGLQDAGSVAAYLAALHVGASPAQAFEAARRHELLMIPEEPYETQTQRRYQYPDEYRAAVRRLQERRERIRAIANPFNAPEVVPAWSLAA